MLGTHVWRDASKGSGSEARADCRPEALPRAHQVQSNAQSMLGHAGSLLDSRMPMACDGHIDWGTE